MYKRQVNADTAASLETGETVDAGDANIIIFDGADVSLDFTSADFDADTFTNVERIDLTGTGDNSVTLSLDDVLDLSDAENELIIDGDDGDSVTATAFVDSGTTETVGDVTYGVYALNEATLLIDEEVAVNV